MSEEEVRLGSLPPISEEEISLLQSEAIDWASCHGLVMYSKDTNQLVHAPFTLLPTPIPRSLFRLANQVGPDFNLLVHEIAKDSEFIIQSLESTGEDPFTKKMVDLYKKVLEEGISQNISLGIHRSDYMIDIQPGKSPYLKQVELNTIAASFSNLSSHTTKLHKYLIERLDSTVYSLDSLPQNDTMKKIPEAFAKAWELYGNKNAVVVMIVHPGETNTFDQRWLEYCLWEKDGKEIAIVYYRAGYTPDDYPSKSEAEWDARLLIERSKAIKCPTLAYHLIGTKKIQQVLAVPEMLERFLPKDSSARLRKVFTGLYSLSEGEGNVAELIEKIRKNPERYVLKPQREGGGNNLYGKDIIPTLDKSTPKQRAAFIVMDRILPPPVPTYFVRQRNCTKSEGVSELGIYSTFVSDGISVLVNDTAGHLLRTKISTVEDGGVASGVAVLDSPYLID